MELQEVEITIDKNGQVEVQVRGVKGAQCLDLTKDLEEALGGEIVLREMTPEALEQGQPIDERVRLRGSKPE
ncbi:MAG TPA: DUF2997 domain-containing protein [Anaerolineaceae bacterium]|nr:DUF2997 domain-containing protein [Anaerolineaceae bacterium]